MIEATKRTAEKLTDDEPLKKKSSKLADKRNVEKKPSKAPKLNDKQKKPFAPTKTTHKSYNDKSAGKSVDKKFTSKNPANKFAIKSTPGKKGAPVDAGAPEKTDWRKFKQDKKELKVKRKQAKDVYEISIEAKQIYEKLKCRRTEQKQELVEKLYNLLNGGDTIKKLVMAHDTARIIQCMLKFASPLLREQISEKLLPLAVDMALSKYSHFCVLRMFKYGSPSTKSKLVDSFLGNVVKLACHNISSKILDHIYLSVASAKQRAYLRQEFYGDLYKKSKDDTVHQLEDTYKETLNMKASILGSVKANLEHVANKQLVDSSLVHAVMLEYLRVCEDDKIEETVSAFSTLIPLMLTTKDGCQAAIICFHKSTTKNRRAIIKTIKEHLVKICTHEHGHIFILAVLNALDDTKATKKAIYDNIHPELETLMANQWGRRVIEWLIAPGNTSCFHPTFIASIELGLEYGKKDKLLRRQEIFEQIEEPISTTMAENPDFWISDRHIGLVTAEILRKLSGEHFVRAATALAATIAQPTWSVTVEQESKERKGKKVHDVEKIIADATKQKKQKLKASMVVNEEQQSAEETPSANKPVEEEIERITVTGIEEAGLHIVLKKIIKNDKNILEKDANAKTFGALLVPQLTLDTIKLWISFNRGCFVLLNILETNNNDTGEKLKSLLESEQVLLKQQKGKGADLLSKKLAE